MDLSRMGFIRIGLVSPELRIADVAYNSRAIVEGMAQAAARGCRLALFPELCVTGYSCADLFFQTHLLASARAALGTLARAAGEQRIAVVVGVPLAVEGRLYNCAALLHDGQVLGLVPKTYLPTTNEFYEERWFTPGRQCMVNAVEIDGQAVPLGTDLLFETSNLAGCVLGIEICEDLWAVQPPSSDMALAGASLLLNPSASNELLGKVDYRRDLVRQQSARCLAAYLYAGSGPNESSTDVVYAGHSLVAENGAILAESERFCFETQLAVADVDVQRLAHERRRNSSFSAAAPARQYRRMRFDLPQPATSAESLLRPDLSRTPFVPADPAQRARHCREIFAIQSTGLARRLKHVGVSRVTLAISGGLDSTLALLVCVKAFDLLGLDRKGVIAVTMPGFGTTERTRTNAETLAEALGVTFMSIPIVDAVRQHFRDIGHPEDRYDVTYENAQARERTQIVMDLANQVGGLQVGTGDLSELALGWSTYNADQMAMYNVNAGVPKTLVRYLIDWAADAEFAGQAAQALHDISATPISPELLPLEEGELAQKTESTIGPYVLHDFFLFQIVRYGFPPRKVFFLAQQVFAGEYKAREILHWLDLFYQRFFTYQFKRSAMPDGPKVGSVALSPRGDWRMPSDASSALWRQEVRDLQREVM